MKRHVFLIGLLLTSAPGLAAETLCTATWERVGEATDAASATQVLPSDNAQFLRMLKVTNPGGSLTDVEVLSVSKPGVKEATYAVTGMVRCEDVQGVACITLWSLFPDGSRYFSRTMAEQGPMERLSGTESWRPFVAPFYLKDHPQRPDRIIVCVSFSGRGTVFLGPLALRQYGAGEDPLSGLWPAAAQGGSSPNAWWNAQTAGLVGGICGGMVGLLGALIGLLTAFGKARRFVVGTMCFCIVAGGALILVGVAALIARQPFGVWFAPLVLGVVLTAVLGGNLSNVRRRYEAVELRRMEAKDAP